MLLSMRNCVCLTVILLGEVNALALDFYCNTSCVSVKTVSVCTKDILDASPLYTLKTSLPSVSGVSISLLDSACFSFYSEESDDGVSYSQGVFTLSNGSSIIFSTIRTEMGRGQFLLNGATSDYLVSYIGKVCSNTFVMYRCSLTQGSSNQYYVSIVSSDRTVSEKCLKKAEKVALKTFPDIQFTTLPNTASYPCLCDSQCFQ